MSRIIIASGLTGPESTSCTEAKSLTCKSADLIDPPALRKRNSSYVQCKGYLSFVVCAGVGAGATFSPKGKTFMYIQRFCLATVIFRGKIYLTCLDSTGPATRRS